MDVGLIAFNVAKGLYGIPGVICRGADNCPVTIVPGFVDSKNITARDINYSSNSLDFLIARSEYKPTGEVSEPQDFDTLVYDDAGETVTVELLPSADGQLCFRSWRGRSVLRLHTKLQERETTA